MNNIPALFKPEMVRGLLREIGAPGTGKTQTRRVLKPHPDEGAPIAEACLVEGFSHGQDEWVCSAITSYRDLWNNINGAGAWDKNPWVVAVTFEPMLKNILKFGEDHE